MVNLILITTIRVLGIVFWTLYKQQDVTLSRGKQNRSKSN